MFRLLQCYCFAKRFHGYRPQLVTVSSLLKWLKPFSRKEQKLLLKFLSTLVYIDEKTTRDLLVSLNTALLKRLKHSGFEPKNVIYVQVHDAGSSSPVMLNMLRDYGHLNRLGCHMIDSKDAAGFSRLFNDMEEGAVVYVDDFAGTGNQFCDVRKMLAPLIPTTFVEFVIMPALCEEAYGQFTNLGIEPYTHIIHGKSDRPLHESCSKLDESARIALRQLCARIVPPFGLGYESLASNIVFYRNAPNTIPAILRGSKGQQPYPGLFPRSDDFAPAELGELGKKSKNSRDRLFRVKDSTLKKDANGKK